MWRFFPALLNTLLAAVAIQGYSTGAPVEVCDSMMPQHGKQPQQTPLPYDIIIEKPKLKGGESTIVTIKGNIIINYYYNLNLIRLLLS